MRIRGINQLSPKVVRIMRLLRLRQLHNATFVRINKSSVNMLRKVESYITFGYISNNSDIHPERRSKSWSTNEDIARSTDKDSQYPTIRSSKTTSESSTLNVLKTWSTKSTIAGHTSKKRTTSYGPSSSEPHEEALTTKGIRSNEEEIGATDRISSTHS